MIGDKGYVLTIGVCYKSPNIEVNEIMDVIKKASNNMVLVMGYFNLPGINWITLEADITGSKFLGLTLDYFLVQHVLKPIRYANILDLVRSSEENMVEELLKPALICRVYAGTRRIPCGLNYFNRIPCAIRGFYGIINIMFIVFRLYAIFTYWRIPFAFCAKSPLSCSF